MAHDDIDTSEAVMVEHTQFLVRTFAVLLAGAARALLVLARALPRPDNEAAMLESQVPQSPPVALAGAVEYVVAEYLEPASNYLLKASLHSQEDLDEEFRQVVERYGKPRYADESSNG